MKTAFLVPPFSVFLRRFANEADFHGEMENGDRARTCLVVERGRRVRVQEALQEALQRKWTRWNVCVTSRSALRKLLYLGRR